MEHEKQKKMNKHTKQKIIRRNNAKLYPIYKMFSWDLICFYSVEFLFYTITKGITASEVLIVNACYIMFKILMQIPAVMITDLLGRRKALIIGNLLLVLFIIILMLSQGIIGIILSFFMCAFGYDIKLIAETNLLYDSVATKGGEGLYSKLDSKGASWYYWLDGIACLSAGYLFVINNYLPMFVCMGFLIISTILSFRFKDVYITDKKEEKENKKMTKILKEYTVDLRKFIKFIIKSSRMRSYLIFGAVFYGIYSIIDIYRSALLTSKGVSEEQYSTIFAILIILAGVSVTLSRKIQKKFKNRTLTFISLVYIFACIVVGIIANVCTNNIAIPIIIVMYAILKMCTAVWHIFEYKYLKNFTTEEIRNKMMFAHGLVSGTVASILSIIGSLILERFEIDRAFLMVGLAGLIGIVLTLDYMKPRFGLRPKEYKKEDIEFKND